MLRPLEEAIRKMTSLATDNLGIKKRGRISIGQPADLILFDPDKLTDQATPKKLQLQSVGIKKVQVNGKEVYSQNDFLAAENLKLRKREALTTKYFADVVIFDPTTIQDHATFENSHQYSTGVLHVFVNGAQVMENGKHTNENPGGIVRGLGYKKKLISNTN